MSKEKNLEIEYKALINNDVPDLWARIEAEISKDENKKEPKNVSEIQDTDNIDKIKKPVIKMFDADIAEKNVIEFHQNNIQANIQPNVPTNIENMPQKKERSKKINYKKWITAAAAIVCVVISAPAIMMLTMHGGSSSSSMSDMAAPMEDVAENAAADVEYAAEPDVAYEENAAAEAACDEAPVKTEINNLQAAGEMAADVELQIYSLRGKITEVNTVDGTIEYTVEVITTDIPQVSEKDVITVIDKLSETDYQNDTECDFMITVEKTGDGDRYILKYL